MLMELCGTSLAVAVVHVPAEWTAVPNVGLSWA